MGFLSLPADKVDPCIWGLIAALERPRLSEVQALRVRLTAQGHKPKASPATCSDDAAGWMSFATYFGVRILFWTGLNRK